MSSIPNRSELQALCRSADVRADTLNVSPILSLRHGGELFTLKANDQKRLELLGRLRSGEGDPVELEVDIRAFQQQDGVANRNFTRFKKSILRKLAKSFKGVPLLRDHDSGSLEARAGTVMSSSAEPIEGGLAFDMTARITAPWAVEAVLAGNLDRFSIGWDFPGLDTLQCSACKCPALTGDCFHFPGDRLEDGGRAEFIFTEAEGVEVSAVSVPAVKGTGLDQVRSALSKVAALRVTHNRDESAEENMENIAKTLGLKSDADESTIIAGVGALKARAESAEAALQAEREEAAEVTSKLAKAEARIEELSAADKERAVDALVSEYANRFPVERGEDGKKITSKLETEVRKLAASDVDAARAMLSAMPELRPAIGVVPASLGTAPAESATPVTLHAVGNSEVGRDQRRQLGMTEEEFAKYNSVNGTATAHLRETN